MIAYSSCSGNLDDKPVVEDNKDKDSAINKWMKEGANYPEIPAEVNLNLHNIIMTIITTTPQGMQFMMEVIQDTAKSQSLYDIAEEPPDSSKMNVNDEPTGFPEDRDQDDHQTKDLGGGGGGKRIDGSEVLVSMPLDVLEGPTGAEVPGSKGEPPLGT